jgi:hypothetical protein
MGATALAGKLSVSKPNGAIEGNTPKGSAIS